MGNRRTRMGVRLFVWSMRFVPFLGARALNTT
jgi:hypothetical protein